jgi:2-oxoglutarate ferredoxin oxidoreductase subunit alpha
LERRDFVVRFAGEGGQGVVTAAEFLARAAATVGYHVMTFATFPSQIKGGPTYTQVRISTDPVLSSGDEIDVLVALNLEAYNNHKEEVREDGVVMYDTVFEIDAETRALGMPIEALAKEAGEARSANMVILGALAHLVDMPKEYFQDFVAERFKGRDRVVEFNTKALELGRQHAATSEFQLGSLMAPIRPEGKQVLIKGNDALSIGALQAGVDYYVGYPISPATPIFIFMEKNLVGPGRFAYQATSEIESITAIIGAGYAGKKAMTATAGPGFTLMSEGLGLAWMAEIPCVVVDVQRGGPATGLPTKTEQSDFQTALHPAHGDSKLPVIAPGTIEECFYSAIHAFNWAERYQGPVILLSEHMMAERSQNIPMPDLNLVPPETRETYKGNNGYLRYDGAELSAMPIPGSPGAYVANGSEHDSYGDTTHLAERHVQMTERRFGKLKLLEDGDYEAEGTDSPIAVMPWGGSKGPGREAWEALTASGQSIGWYYTMFLHPLPAKLLEELLQKELVIVPELNYLGQFSSYLRTYGIRAESLTQYTGLPFKVSVLEERITKRVEAHGRGVVRV